MAVHYDLSFMTIKYQSYRKIRGNDPHIALRLTSGQPMTVSFGIKSPPPNVLIALGCRPSRISIQGYKGNKRKSDFEQKFKHKSYRMHTTTIIRTELLKTNTAENNDGWISMLL